MEQTKLQAVPREPGSSNAARRMRESGDKLPAVVYGGDKENYPITVDPRELVEILTSEAGENTIIELSVEGQDEADTVMIQDYEVDALGRRLLHADFLRISLTDKMEVEVPIRFVGSAQGVKEGGVLEIVTRHLSIRCLPTDIPDEIEVEVDDLEIGDSLHVSNLNIPGDIEVLDDPHRAVVNCSPPMKEEELEPEGIDLLEEVAEPELIRPEREGEEVEVPEELEEAVPEEAEEAEEPTE